VKFRNTAVIYTERLCLRPVFDRDKEDMLTLLTNEAVSETYMLPVFHSRDEALGLFEALKRLSISDDRFVYGISLDDRVIGLINDVQIDDKEVELGYVIHPSYHNKGYATEALRAAMEEIFLSGYTAVQTGAFAENTPSMRVMEKCGMTRTTQEETIPYRGKLHRCIYYRKERPVFEERSCEIPEKER
jgi:RimJ/RimL family protein N-acetyltransferase